MYCLAAISLLANVQLRHPLTYTGRRLFNAERQGEKDFDGN